MPTIGPPTQRPASSGLPEPSAFQGPEEKIPDFPVSRNNLPSRERDRLQGLPAELRGALDPQGVEVDRHDIAIEGPRNDAERLVGREGKVSDELLRSREGILEPRAPEYLPVGRSDHDQGVVVARPDLFSGVVEHQSWIPAVATQVDRALLSPGLQVVKDQPRAALHGHQRARAVRQCEDVYHSLVSLVVRVVVPLEALDLELPRRGRNPQEDEIVPGREVEILDVQERNARPCRRLACYAVLTIFEHGVGEDLARI